MENDSHRLLADYAELGSEAAFQELIKRYLDLVYSTAVRAVGGDTHLAADVAQTVFIDLAHAAPSLSKEVMLGGWLHRHTCFVASNTIRGERRRRLREQQFVEMNALQDASGMDLARVAPMLDEAINQLGEPDRAAILLRFFERRDLRSVGEALGGSENAAQKRVARALEELRDLLKRRGVTCSAMALGAALAGEAVTAAPAGLAASIAATALASAATGASAALTFSKIIAMTKMKAVLIGAIVIAGAVTPVLLQHRATTELLDENRVLRKQSEQVNALRAENEQLASLKVDADELQRLRNEHGELLRLRNEVTLLRQPATTPTVPARKIGSTDEVLTLYAQLTGKTVLRAGTVPALQDALNEGGAGGSEATITAITDVLKKNQMELVPSGPVFVLVIPAGWRETPLSTQLASIGSPPVHYNRSATNMFDFPGVDVNTFLRLFYAPIRHRTVLQSAALPSCVIRLRAQQKLTPDETVYAFNVLLALNGIAVFDDGERFVQVVQTSAAGNVQLRAPKPGPDEPVLDPSKLPEFTDSRTPQPAAQKFVPGAGSVGQFTIYYASLTGQKTVPTARYGEMPIVFKAQTPMTKEELLYALQTTLALNGLAITSAGDNSIRVTPLAGGH